MSIFGPSKSQIESDRCINDVLEFIKVALKIEPTRANLATITIRIDNAISCEYGQFDDNSMVCICKNQILKGENEAVINKLIGKEIHADELPSNSDIEFHMDESNGRYDYYIIKSSFNTQYKHCENEYVETITDLLNRNNISICFVSKKDLKHKYALIKVIDFDN